MPHWTAILSALLTPVVAALGLFIAYRQSVIAQNKLKFDLFEKRFAVYDTARDLLRSATTSEQLTEEMLSIYRAGTREARWLCDKRVDDYLNKTLYAQSFLLLHLSDDLNRLELSDPKRPSTLRQLADAQSWFHQQQEILDDLFAQYLEVQH